MAKLGEVFREIMKRQAEKIDPVRSKFGKIEKEEVSLSDKFVYVHEYMRQHKRFSFRQLLLEQKSKMHIVVTFLAILEMMKLGEIYVEQEKIPRETFRRRMEIEKNRNPNLSIVLRADTKSEHGDFVFVLDQLKSVGISKIGIATEAKSQSKE